MFNRAELKPFDFVTYLKNDYEKEKKTVVGEMKDIREVYNFLYAHRKKAKEHRENYIKEESEAKYEALDIEGEGTPVKMIEKDISIAKAWSRHGIFSINPVFILSQSHLSQFKICLSMTDPQWDSWALS